MKIDARKNCFKLLNIFAANLTLAWAHRSGTRHGTQSTYIYSRSLHFGARRTRVIIFFLIKGYGGESHSVHTNLERTPTEQRTNAKQKCRNPEKKSFEFFFYVAHNTICVSIINWEPSIYRPSSYRCRR